MRVFLLPKEYSGEPVHHLSKKESRYLFSVLRLEINETITAKDRDGKYYKAFLFSDNEMALEPTDEPEATLLDSLSSYEGGFIPIHAFISVLKNRKTETAVRMLTEIGVCRIVLMETEFTEGTINAHQLERLETIVREAVQQSGSAVPELIGPLPFAKALPLLPIAKAISGASCVSYMIGPEGGFSDRECESAEHEAALPVLLPTNILRAETATVYAASAIQTLLNEQTAGDLER